MMAEGFSIAFRIGSIRLAGTLATAASLPGRTKTLSVLSSFLPTVIDSVVGGASDPLPWRVT